MRLGLLAFLLSIATCALLILATLPVDHIALAQQTNLLSNPGFEQGSGVPDAWQVSNGTIRQAQQTFRSGISSLALEGNSDGDRYALQVVQVQPGGTYQASVWAYKSDPLIIEVYLQVEQYTSVDGTGGPVFKSYSLKLKANAASFQQLVIDRIIALDTARSFRVGLVAVQESAANTTVYFDDASLVQTAAPPPLTSTPTPTPTATSTSTPTPTRTPAPTATPTVRPTSTARLTATPSETPVPPIATATPSPAPSIAPTAPATPVPAAPDTPAPSPPATATPTRAPASTQTPRPTQTTRPTPTPPPTATLRPPTAPPTPRPSATPSGTPTATPVPPLTGAGTSTPAPLAATPPATPSGSASPPQASTGRLAAGVALLAALALVTAALVLRRLWKRRA